MRQSISMLLIASWVTSGLVLRAEAGGPWYVTSSGTPGDGQSWAQAFTNIQTAIDTATEGDTIYLAAQTFTPPASALGVGKLIWTNKALTILGGYAVDGGSPGALAAIPTTISNAVTYQANTNRIMYIVGVTNGTLARVKLVGGKIGYPTAAVAVSAGFYGAGIYMENCTNMTLESLECDANAIGVQQSGKGDGAGLYATNSWGTISNSVFQNNLLGSVSACITRGGGMHGAGGGWTLRDCIIRDNMRAAQFNYTETSQGIGLFFGGGTHLIQNCVVSRNYGSSNITKPKGDALYLASGTVTVENCTIYWHHFEGVQRFAGLLTLRDTIVWDCGDDVVGAVTLNYCNIQDGDSNGVSGTISSDPLFERGLYLSTNSPCVNAGSRAAAEAGVDGRTTQAGGASDTGTVDMGYHFAAGHAADLFVSVNSGDDSYAGTNAGAPFKTIGKAFAVAGDGVHINVAAGLYTTNTETFPLMFPANVYGVQLLGTNAAETILDARQRNARVLGMTCNYPGARVTGLTLKGADYQMPSGAVGGGGLYASHSRGTIEDCVAVSNTIRNSGLDAGAHYGGGIGMERSYFVVSNCAVGSNSVQSGRNSHAYGGGIAWEASDGVLERCMIVSNQALPGIYLAVTRGMGGGAYLSSDDSGIEMRNCLIAGNNAADGTTNAWGGGLYNASTVVVFNCTIVSNRLTGIYGASTVWLTNGIAWGNVIDVTGTVKAALSDIGAGSYTAGAGCLSVDPLFVNAAGADFRLALGSPCVNTGTNQAWMETGLDLPGNPRINNSVVDMGAYEQVTPVYIVNRNPGNVTATTAYLNGSLLSTGFSPTHVWLFWGPTDGTTNKNQWANTNDFGIRAVGDLTTNVSFTGGTTYFYRYYASNEIPAESWASPSLSFDVAGGISVVASDPSAAELGQDLGVFTLSRPASATGLPVTVNFTLTGSALNGVDYQSIATNVIIPAGVSNITVTIIPAIDRIVEGTNDVILTIVEGSYLIESPSTAMVSIADWIAPQTVCVSAGGAGTYATNWASAFTTIQSAIDAAQNSDTIYLAAQTFTLPEGAGGLGKLVWTNKMLSILGGGDTNDAPGVFSAIPTTLYSASDYAGNTNRLLFIAGVTNGTLARVKLVGGKIGYPTSAVVVGADFYGAGIYMEHCTNMNLESLTFDANAIGVQQSGKGDGAGLYATNSWGTISNSVFQNNLLGSYASSSSRGGGMHAAGGGWTLRDCIIRDNMRVAQFSYSDICQGIGLYFNGGTHFVRNCVVSRNYGRSNITKPQGDALYLASGTVTVENCTFYWHHFEGVQRSAGLLTLRDSIVWDCGDDIVGTITLQNCDIQDGDSNGVNGNISSDPLFERGLYLSTSSPCVNTGSRTAVAAELAGRTTSAAGSSDAGMVDMGYHFAAGPAADLFVSVTSGSDANAGTNAAAGFQTIGKALAMAGAGTRIYVAAGLYTTNTETFPLMFPANVYGVQLLGVNASNTILDARQRNARVLGMTYNYPGARVTGLTMMGADYQMPDSVIGRGGGFYASHSRGTVEDCVVVSNKIRSSVTAGSHLGGGVCMERSYFVVSRCLVASNSVRGANYGSASGGGIAWEDSDGMLESCSIVSNRATPGATGGTTRGSGGGVYLSADDSGIEMRNCLISENQADNGTVNAMGGGLCNASTVTVVNCTIASNNLTGIYGASLAALTKLTNCIVWGNGVDVTGTVTAAYSDIGIGTYTDGGNNKSAYPIFATNPASFQISKAGPCYNAGVEQSWMAGGLDLAGQPRIAGIAPDMGCYEAQPVISGAIYSLR